MKERSVVLLWLGTQLILSIHLSSKQKWWAFPWQSSDIMVLLYEWSYSTNGGMSEDNLFQCCKGMSSALPDLPLLPSAAQGILKWTTGSTLKASTPDHTAVKESWTHQKFSTTTELGQKRGCDSSCQCLEGLHKKGSPEATLVGQIKFHYRGGEVWGLVIGLSQR